MDEEQYDSEIAPDLRQVMSKVHSLGGSIIAFCEFTDNEGERGWGLTADVPKHSAHSKLVEMAVRCNGNLDGFLMGLIKAHEAGVIDCSPSIMFEKLTRPTP